MMERWRQAALLSLFIICLLNTDSTWARRGGGSSSSSGGRRTSSSWGSRGSQSKPSSSNPGSTSSRNSNPYPSGGNYPGTGNRNPSSYPGGGSYPNHSPGRTNPGGYPAGGSYPNQNPAGRNPAAGGYPAGGSYPNQNPAGRNPAAGGYPNQNPAGGYPNQNPAGGYPAAGGYPNQNPGRGNYPAGGGYPNQNPGRGYPNQYPGAGGYPNQNPGRNYPNQYPAAGGGGYPNRGGYPAGGSYPGGGSYPAGGGYPNRGGYPNQYPAAGGYPGRGGSFGYPQGNPNNKIMSPHIGGGAYGYGGYGMGGSPFSRSVQSMGYKPKSSGFAKKAIVAAGVGAVAGMAVGYGLGRFPRPHFSFHNPQEEYYYNNYMYRRYGSRSTDEKDFGRDYVYKPPPRAETYDAFMAKCMNRTDLLKEQKNNSSGGIQEVEDDTVSIEEIGYPSLIEQVKARRCVENYMVYSERFLEERKAEPQVQPGRSGPPSYGVAQLGTSLIIMLSSMLLLQ